MMDFLFVQLLVMSLVRIRKYTYRSLSRLEMEDLPLEEYLTVRAKKNLVSEKNHKN